MTQGEALTILKTGANVFLTGEPGSGKSVLVLMLAHHIATGKSWAGRDVTRSSVLYCALEGPTGTKRRVLAIRQALAADKHTITLALGAGDTIAVGDMVRVIAIGTGATPILGEDGIPLAGAVGDPPASRLEGRNFVTMQARS